MNPPFAPVVAAAALMQGFPGPWFVSGGWAIDLFLERVTRKHSDIEIGIYRRQQNLLWTQLSGWRLEKAIETPAGEKSHRWDPWDQGEDLRLPIHQIRATAPTGDPAEVDFLLNERTDTHWVFRRHPDLQRPVEEVAIISSLGIPILAPEIQLLFKAKQTRAKDQADFESTLPRLTMVQRGWLADALQRYHADHAWLVAIRECDYA